MMTEQRVQAIMQCLPEEYLEEALTYRMANLPKTDADTAAPASGEPTPILVRAALPLAAAACLAAVCGLIWWVGSRDDMLTVESHTQEIEEQLPAALTSTVTETDSDSGETDARTTESAVTGTTAAEHAVGSLRVTAADTTNAQRQTAAKGTAATGTQNPAKQTAKPAQTTTKPAAGTMPPVTDAEEKLPYDPDIVAQYRLGDVNMDGEITLYDVNLLLEEFHAVCVYGGESILTPEQRYLGNVTDQRILPDYAPFRKSYFDGQEPFETDYIISSADVYWLLEYYTQTYLGHRREVPIDVFIAFGYVPYVDENGEYCQDYYGDRYEGGATNDITELQECGISVISAWAYGEKEWQLWEYYHVRSGGDVRVRYYNADDDVFINIRYGLSDEVIAYRLNQIDKYPEEYTVLPWEGETAWRDRYGNLYWLTDGYLMEFYYGTDSVDEIIDIAQTFRNAITLG